MNSPRITVRVSSELLEKMENAVNSGRFKDVSDLVRVAVGKLLEVKAAQQAA